MAITKTQKTLEKQGWAIKFNMAATGSNKVIATKGQKTVNGSSVTDVYKKIKTKYSGSLGTTKKKAKAAPKKRKTAKKATGVGSTTKRKTAKKKATGSAKRKGVGSTSIPKKKAKIYQAWCNGTLINIKAFSKVNAVKRFQEYDSKVAESDVTTAKTTNSHQSPIDGISYTPKKRKTAKKRVTKKRVGNPKHKVSKPTR